MTVPHLKVISSEVLYLEVLHDKVCALFTIRAEVLRIIVLQIRLLEFKAHEFSIGALRARPKDMFLGDTVLAPH